MGKLTEEGYILGNTSLNNSELKLLGIDLAGAVTLVCSKLSKLKSTYVVIWEGPYIQDPSWHKVLIWTSMTESELETWLWKIELAAEFDYSTYECSPQDIENQGHWITGKQD